MTDSRNILLKLLPTKASNIPYILGSTGILGALFLLYYYKEKQLRLISQKKRPSHPSPEEKIEENCVDTAISKTNNSAVENGDINNIAVSSYANASATDDKVVDGNLTNASIAPSINRTMLQYVLQQSNLKKPLLLPIDAKKPTKKISPVFSSARLETDEKKHTHFFSSTNTSSSTGHTVKRGSIYTISAGNNVNLLYQQADSSSQNPIHFFDLGVSSQMLYYVVNRKTQDEWPPYHEMLFKSSHAIGLDCPSLEEIIEDPTKLDSFIDSISIKSEFFYKNKGILADSYLMGVSTIGLLQRIDDSSSDTFIVMKGCLSQLSQRYNFSTEFKEWINKIGQVDIQESYDEMHKIISELSYNHYVGNIQNPHKTAKQGVR